MSTSTRAGVWPLVGRRAELARVVRLLEEPGPVSIVIAGEAGVGKTRLAREALTIARDSGRVVRWVAAVRAASEIPFGAFAQLLPQPAPGLADGAAYMRAAARALAEAPQGESVVLAVDDGHALDTSSAALLHQLVATGMAATVVTVRHGEPAADAITALWKDELAEYVELRPLGEEQVAELLPLALGGEVDGATIRDLFAATLGNPMYLRVLVAEGMERGALAPVDGIWRWSGPVRGGGRLFELVQRSLGRLDAAKRAALLTVAVGEPLSADVLERLTSPAALESLERRGIVLVERADRRTEVLLAHPLYGEFVRMRTSVARLSAVRGRLAAVVEATGMRRRDDVLRVARWRLDAGLTGSGELMLAAALQARAAHDPVLAEQLARTAERAGAGAMARAVLADAVFEQGRVHDAVELLSDPPVEASDDAARVMIATTLARALFFGLGEAVRADGVVAAAEAAVADVDLRDELVAFRGAIRLFTGRPLDALAVTRPVLARRDVKARAAVRAGCAAIPAGAISGNTDEMIAFGERWREAAIEIEPELPFAPSQFLGTWALCLMFAGELDRALVSCEQFYKHALERRDDSGAALWAYMLGRAQLARGLVRTAQRWLREASASLRDRDEGGLLSMSLASLAQALALSGESDAAEATLAEGIAARRPAEHLFDPDVGLARVWIAASRGELSSARERALEVATRAAAAGMFGFAAIALYDVARLGGAGRVLARLRQVVKGVDGRLAPAYLAGASALRARDANALEQVAQQFEAIGALLLAAEAASEAAAAHSAAGDSTRAVAAGTTARALMARCEGAFTPSLGNAVPVAGLTLREREVAALAASGLTSAEIARKLSLSARTVESHLYHSYRKLGVGDRAGLATALRRLAAAGVDPPQSESSVALY